MFSASYEASKTLMHQGFKPLSSTKNFVTSNALFQRKYGYVLNPFYPDKFSAIPVQESDVIKLLQSRCPAIIHDIISYRFSL